MKRYFVNAEYKTKWLNSFIEVEELGTLLELKTEIAKQFKFFGVYPEPKDIRVLSINLL